MMLMILSLTMIVVTMFICCLSFKCGLPSLEECKALAEAAMCEGDLFSAVKFHLLSSEPENSLQIGIDHVKGSDNFVSVWLAKVISAHLSKFLMPINSEP